MDESLQSALEETSLFGNTISSKEYLASLPLVNVSKGKQLSSSTSKGNQEKWYLREEDIFVKAAFCYDGITWKDYVCEQIACRMGEQLGIEMADTAPCRIFTNDNRELIGSRSISFLKSNEIFVTFDRLLTRFHLTGFVQDFYKLSTLERITRTAQVYAEFCELDAGSYLFDMICLDYLIGNEDRHNNNFGVIYSVETEKFRFAPHFDNGLSLFEHDTKYRTMPIHVCIRKMDGKPFSTDLEKSYRAAQKVFHKDGVRGKLDLNGIVFPSQKAVEYVEQAASKMGLEVNGTAVVIDG